MATLARLTFDDLAAIPEEHEGDRHELMDGELIVSPPPSIPHQIINVNLVLALGQFIRERDLGTLLTAPAGVKLSPENVLIPDLVFVAHERKHLVQHLVIDGPPSLVVEILSPGTRRRDHIDKRELYARFGVPEYWIVDPAARTVTVLALTDDHYEEVQPGEGGAIRSLVLPDLVLFSQAVFAGA